MPLYAIDRDLGAVTDDELDAAAFRAVFCSYVFEGSLKWIRSYFEPDTGQIVCIYEAENEAQIREHSQLAHLPCDRVREVRELLAESYAGGADEVGPASEPASST